MQARFDPFNGEAFTRTWWTALFEHAPTPAWAQRFKAWAVADKLMERYYVEVGLQAILGWDAVDAPGVHLASPGCLEAPRYFGHCDGIGVSTAHDLAGLVNVGLDGVEVVPVCVSGFDPDQPEGYYKLERAGDVGCDEVDVFGLDYDGESGHERCLHRVATSPAHLMFRLALLARLYRWFMDDFDGGFIASLPSADALKRLMTQKSCSRVSWPTSGGSLIWRAATLVLRERREHTSYSRLPSKDCGSSRSTGSYVVANTTESAC